MLKINWVQRDHPFQFSWFTEGYSALGLDHCRKDQYVGDFCDGMLYKQHKLFGQDSKALQIIAYSDEVEVCNPLAGHAGIHKLGISL